MTRLELISKLVTENHLNVIERNELKFILMNELTELIGSTLHVKNIFPSNATIWNASESVFEGWIIEKTGDHFTVLIQRAFSNNPYLLADSKHYNFDDIDSAIKFYIEKAFDVSVDGIPIL